MALMSFVISESIHERCGSCSQPRFRPLTALCTYNRAVLCPLEVHLVGQCANQRNNPARTPKHKNSGSAGRRRGQTLRCLATKFQTFRLKRGQGRRRGGRRGGRRGEEARRGTTRRGRRIGEDEGDEEKKKAETDTSTCKSIKVLASNCAPSVIVRSNVVRAALRRKENETGRERERVVEREE